MKYGKWLKLALACALLACHQTPSPDQSKCQQYRQGALQTGRARLLIGSRLLKHNSLQLGSVSPCRASTPETRIFGRALRALQTLPSNLHPPVLTLHYRPSLAENVQVVAAVEVHRVTGSLLVSSAAENVPTSVWLHEIAHLAMLGPRPSSLLARRLTQSIEESFADTIAALALTSPLLGGGPMPLRDLSATSQWQPNAELLAATGVFDPHPLGLGLARRLWTRRSALQPDSLAQCLRDASDLRSAHSRHDTLHAVLAACPNSVRSALHEAFNQWLPGSLESVPTN